MAKTLTLLFAEDIQREARCLMQHPRYGQRDGYGGGERSPIAQAHRLERIKYTKLG